MAHQDTVVKSFEECIGLLHALKKEAEKCNNTETNTEKYSNIHQTFLLTLCNGFGELAEKTNLPKYHELLIRLCDVTSNVLCQPHPSTLKLKHAIAAIYAEKQKYDLALSIQDEAYQGHLLFYGQDNEETLRSLVKKADLLFLKCQFDSAWNAYVKVYNKRKSLLDPQDAKTLQCRQLISRTLCEFGAYNRARQNFKAIYHIQTKNGHELEAITTAKYLATLYLKQRKYEKSFEIFNKVYTIECQKDSKDPHTLCTRSNMAEVLAEEGRYKEAICIYNEILQLQISSGSRDDAMDTENKKAMILTKQGDFESAHQILSKLNTEYDRMFGSEHLKTICVKYNLATLLCSERSFDEALSKYNEVRAARDRILGSYHSDTLKATCGIARVYVNQRKYEEALGEYIKARNLMQAVLCPEHTERLSVDTEIAEVYVNQKKYVEAFQMYYDVYERTAVMYGVDHRYTSGIKEKMLQIPREEASLIKATRKGHLNTVKSCLGSGADIDLRDNRGYTALHIASQKGDDKMLNILLSNGANYEVKNMAGETPADIAGNRKVKNILDSVSRLFSLVDANDYDQVTEILAKEQAIKNAKDQDGCSALIRSCDFGFAKIVKKLIYSGVNLEAVSKQGRTALHEAAFRGHIEIIFSLLEYVFLDREDDDFHKFLNTKTTYGGETALHMAARANNSRAFQLLLDHGANSDLTDKLGRSPFDVTDDSAIKNLQSR